MPRGGRREGAGRKLARPELGPTTPVSVSLPEALREWLELESDSRSSIVTDALLREQKRRSRLQRQSLRS
jgi:hypothetical protein